MKNLFCLLAFVWSLSSNAMPFVPASISTYCRTLAKDAFGRPGGRHCVTLDSASRTLSDNGDVFLGNPPARYAFKVQNDVIAIFLRGQWTHVYRFEAQKTRLVSTGNAGQILELQPQKN